jgi:hypothetical protein
MPITWEDLPEDDPIFSGGVRFVFRNEEPPEITPADEDEVAFISPSVPGRRVRLRSIPTEEDEQQS